MARRKENTWQFKFSSILATIMLFLIVGYFFQSYNQIRQMKPFQAAVEFISSKRVDQAAEPTPVHTQELQK